MIILTEGRHAGEFVISEANGMRARDVGTLAAGQDLAAGTVLGTVTATGDYAALAPGAADGTETASAVLYSRRKGPEPCVAYVRDAVLNAAELTWPAGSTAGEIETATAELDALGIVLR